MAELEQNSGSFRDPAGFVLKFKNKIYRQINQTGKEDYEFAKSSGLYDELIKLGLLVEHSEVKDLKVFSKDANRYKVIKPAVIPFISYPYEWSFGQLRDAALATLKVQAVAIKHGLMLKDASAYNIQFVGNKPVFIDTLSFEKYEAGDTWKGYKQFCEHFIAPLALAHFASPELLKTQRTYIDGIPLRTVCRLLPKRAKLQRGLFAHLYLHNKAQLRHSNGGKQSGDKARKIRMSKLAFEGLMASLETTVKKLKPWGGKTEWGDYYTFTNYTDKSFDQKKKVISKMLDQIKPTAKVVWDLGANNGEFSEIAAAKGAYTVAFDIDEIAVGRNYHAKRENSIKSNMLPLVQDLTNPSPGLGWAHKERESLVERGPADVVMALALIHHLAIGNNLPFDQIAKFLRSVAKNVIIEFVPKQDSKVQLLLSSREDIFVNYDAPSFEAAMEKHFKLISLQAVKGSKRSLYLYRAR